MAMRTWRTLQPGQVCRLTVIDVTTGTRNVVHEDADAVIEAPNWVVSPLWGDDAWLLFNREGLMYRVPTGGGTVHNVPTGTIDSSNNDHVVSPDGRWLYVSAEDGHIHRVSLADGTTRPVTHEGDRPLRHYLHGISPDGRTLSYIGLEPQAADAAPGTPARTNVFTIDVDGTHDRQLTFSDRPHDGAEFAPDGDGVFFNSERASAEPGHAQLFRCDADGSAVLQLTFDERVNWFPHPAPGGRDLVYVSYEPGTVGHPANRPVLIRRIDPRGGAPIDVARVFGGQGTMNVPSWSPDGRRFAYVDYPLAA